MEKKNKRIRNAIQSAGVKYWEVADAIGIADTTFARWLRHELPDDKQKQILKMIDELKEGKA